MTQLSPAPDHPRIDWWRSAVIYQVYPRSFADSDGDGIGDLPGVTARLDHLAELGVDALWLSPFYVSPMADAGYDVADPRDVDPRFGTLADADELIAGAHARGLRVIVDVVPNHTSDAHRWFVDALAAGPGSRERARYLFRDGVGDAPPNSWQSVFGGPAWTRVADGQWYLHLFDSRQPDLDWSRPEVRAEFLDVLAFWLDRGVDGFRVDVAHGLVKAEGLPEWAGDQRLLQADGQAPMWDQDGVHEIYREWRALLETYPGERVLVAEATVPPDRMARYVRPDEMHQAFNFAFLEAPWRADALRTAIASSTAATDAVGAPTTWVLSNHDVVRHTTRLTLPEGPRVEGIGPRDPQPDEAVGLRRGRAASLLMLALPGSAYLYQGEELGMPEHTTLPDEVRQDPSFFRHHGTVAGRDGCRVPLPWRADDLGPSWLPHAEWADRYAVDRQSGDPRSTLELYRATLALRRSLRLGEGSLELVDGFGDDIVAVRNGDVLVLTNLGADPVDLPDGAEVLLRSEEFGAPGRVPVDVTVWVRVAAKAYGTGGRLT